jgi:hypothetical protein
VYQCDGDSTVAVLVEVKLTFDVLFTSKLAGFFEDNLPAVNTLLMQDWIDTEKVRFVIHIYNAKDSGKIR